MNLREVLGALRRYVWVIVGLTAITTSIAVYSVKTERPSYSSAAVIRLKDARRALTGGLTGSPVEGISGRIVDPVQSQVEILTSRTVAAQVVDSVHELRVSPRGFPDSLLVKIVTTALAGEDSVAVSFSHGD